MAKWGQHETQSRRAILTHLVAGGIAATIAGPVAPATAAGIDPVFGLIEAHRTATNLHSAALREQERCEQADVPKFRYDAACEAACHADMKAWRELVNTAPQTVAGMKAWVFYLDEVRKTESWMLEDEAQAIVKTLAAAIDRICTQ